MSIGAIKDDVPEIDPRDEAIAEIAKDRQDERDEEFRSEGLEVPKLDGEVEEDPEEVSDEEAANDEQEEGEEKSAEEEAGSEEEQEKNNKKHTLKVDGEEVEVDEQAIIDAGIRTLQKESSADKRLEEATRLLKEAREQTTNSQPPEKTDAGKTSLSEDEAKEIAHSIQYGDESESAEAIQKMVGRSQATQATDESTVDVDAAINDRLAFNDAVKMMEKSPEDGGFSDILENPQLRQILENTEAELRSKQEWNSYTDLFSAAGKSVREFRDNLVGKTSENVTDIKSRQQRKIDSTSSLNAASGSNQGEQKPEKPKTRSQVIEEMRKSR